MRKNIAFINLTDFSAFIAPSLKRPRFIKDDKKKPFIIVNTDFNCGVFVKTIVARANNLGLSQQPAPFRQKDIKSIKTNELIVFGDASAFCDFDYRVETDAQSLAKLNSRKWKVYSLTEDFDAILRRLDEYAKANNKKSPQRGSFELEISIERSYSRPPAPKVACPVACPLLSGISIPRTTTGIRKVDYNRFKDFIGFPRPAAPQIQDVAVHYNWVKIGYNQYDINLDTYGREHIILESGAVLYIKEDRFGRRYLAQ